MFFIFYYPWISSYIVPIILILIFRISTVTGIYTSSISIGIISATIFFLMVLEKLYTVDGASSSCRLFGKQYMISFSFKTELRWINSSSLLSKWIGMVYFDGYFYLSDFLYTFVKTLSAMRASHLFWNCCIAKFELDTSIILILFS